MDVELYVYDLSGGIARQYSVALTGVYIDAIYHTAVVLGGVEYFFGQGVHRKVPGSTHHGRPMEVIRMGRTDLPMEVIEEYVQSLESIYTPESYDLFVHNCNNFSQDLCMFLVGKSIPEKISSLPETFLKTPIGQMMRGQIDQSMRRMTQAPDAASGRNAAFSRVQNSRPHTNGVHPSGPSFINSKRTGATTTVLHAQSRLKLPKLEKRITEPILAKICPPLDKLSARISPHDPGPVQDLVQFVKLREAKGPDEAPLPDLSSLSEWISRKFEHSDQFAIVDLLRISAVDPRVSAFLATDTETISTILACFKDVSKEVPYNIHFASLQLGINMFSSPVAQEALIKHESTLRSLVGNLAAASLLTDNSKIRFQTASLVHNLAAIDHNQRLDGQPDIMNINQIADGAIESALVQAILDEDDEKTLDRLLSALGSLLYRAPEDSGSTQEICEAMELGEVLKTKRLSKEPSTREVLKLLDKS